MFILNRVKYPMLPVSLNCPFLIASSVFSNVYSQYILLFKVNIFDITQHDETDFSDAVVQPDYQYYITEVTHCCGQRIVLIEETKIYSIKNI
jgi:hypothetical protein